MVFHNAALDGALRKVTSREQTSVQSSWWARRRVFMSNAARPERRGPSFLPAGNRHDGPDMSRPVDLTQVPAVPWAWVDEHIYGAIRGCSVKVLQRERRLNVGCPFRRDPGMVCSIADPEMAGGRGEFRVTGWRLNKDYSIDISGRTTTDSMYTLAAGPKPADVTADPVPTELYAVPRGLIWAPFAEQPNSADPLYDEQDWTFQLTQDYTTLADGSIQAVLKVTGRLPINQYIGNFDAPQIRKLSHSATGGSIPGGHTYYAAVCARKSDGTLSPPSNLTSSRSSCPPAPIRTR